ncbi:helix-turn-helix domain-containing protein [Pasteurella sp. PK-2025]|uniref:helix-turn-helix domain-containing protein n=1 Tax=Pasteurella sp. PK-2025 TaxID=3413133 RepID=UPI003C786370
MNIDGRYFSIQELSKKGLGSVSKLKRLVADGKIKSFKIGRSRKIAESDLVEYINSCQK